MSFCYQYFSRLSKTSKFPLLTSIIQPRYALISNKIPNPLPNQPKTYPSHVLSWKLAVTPSSPLPCPPHPPIPSYHPPPFVPSLPILTFYSFRTLRRRNINIAISFLAYLENRDEQISYPRLFGAGDGGFESGRWGFGL